jgi:hypothetical protein
MPEHRNYRGVNFSGWLGAKQWKAGGYGQSQMEKYLKFYLT